MSAVRPERPGDEGAVREVVTLAFGRPDEACLVERVRASEHYVPELSLVAETDGEIVGHALLSHVFLEARLDRWTVLALAPLAVHPGHQGRGVGGALLEAGLGAADARGEPMVLVLGHPAYYSRFGFEPARRHGIDPPLPHMPDATFMVRLLRADDGRRRGRVRYPPAFGPLFSGHPG